MVDDPAKNEADGGADDDRRDGASSAPDAASPDLAAALLRTLLGGTVEGIERLLRTPVDNPGESSSIPDAEPPADSADRVRHALVGLLFDSYGAARKGISTAGKVASAGWSLVEPVAAPLLKPVKRPADALVERWVRIGRDEEQRGRESAREVAQVPVEQVVAYLRENPEMEALVKSQAEALLARLQDDPQVTSLVRSQGDEYLDHLRENPQGVQELVQGQSVGMVNEILDVVRRQASLVDSRLEDVVRAMLGRRPRDQVPGPSPEVRALAGNPRLRSDE